MMPEMCPGGFEEEKVYKFNVYTGDGELLTALDGSKERLPNIKCDADVAALAGLQELFDGMSREFVFAFEADRHIKIPKSLKRIGICKNKKRFIKLMMSRGMPRNVAHELAKVPGYAGGMWSFQFWYKSLCGYERKYGGICNDT